MGFDLLSYKEQSKAGRLFGRKGITRRELINFTFHIEQLVKAGVPLIDSLKDVRDSMDYSHFTDVLQTVIDDIEGGKTLSQALPHNRDIMLALRKNPTQRLVEKGPKGKIELDYEIRLTTLTKD